MGWITDTKAGEKTEREEGETKPAKTSEVRKFRTSEVPKYKTYEVRLTVLMRKDQLDALNELERKIMSRRDKDHKERGLPRILLSGPIWTLSQDWA